MPAPFPFRRFVIWGLRETRHTHRYIHLGFFHAAKRLGVDVVWAEDSAAEADTVRDGDLVLSVNVAGENLPVVKGARYVFHNFTEDRQDQVQALGEQAIHLQVFTDTTIAGAERFGASCTWLNRATRTLIQPWGTNLSREEFNDPAPWHFPAAVFWIGSVWNNALEQGNVKEYIAMRTALRAHRRLIFRPKVNDVFAAWLIRHSALSPAIAGRWQVENNYLPCRLFKNISYGQLGSTNVAGFSAILGDTAVISTDIREVVERDLSLRGAERREHIRAQQERIAEHTYAHKLANMVRALEEFRAV